MSSYFGKYKGQVIPGPPLPDGKLLVICDDVTGPTPVVATPCVPYAGPGVGWHILPPPGARVWVEFEAGDSKRPIWVGCFWDDLTGPIGLPTDQFVQLGPFRMTVRGTTLTVGLTALPPTPPPGLPLVKLQIDALGASLASTPCEVRVSTTGVSVNGKALEMLPNPAHIPK